MDESQLSRKKSQFGKFVAMDGLLRSPTVARHTLRSEQLINGPSLLVFIARTEGCPESSLGVPFPQLDL
jgi:hypothetical protein